MTKKIGIMSYGVALPRQCVSLKTLCQLTGQDESAAKALGIKKRSVATAGQDSFTLGAEAGFNAINALPSLNKNEIAGLFFGSETPLYASNPTAPFLAEALGLREEDFQAGDTEFACKSGSFALDLAMSKAETKNKTHLVIAADIGTGRKGDALFLTAGSGAVALVVGDQGVIAEHKYSISITQNREDFWKPHGQDKPNHAGRWSNDAYLNLIKKTAEKLLEKAKMKMEQIDHVVLHMPNGKLPLRAGKSINATKEQMQHGYTVSDHGNLYSACNLMGLSSVLDIAKPGEQILHISYGSGAGTDGFLWEITPEIENYRKNKTSASTKDVIKNMRELKAEEFIALSHLLT